MKTTPRVNVFTDFAAFCKLRDELLAENKAHKPLLLSMKSDWMADILSGRKQEEYRPFKDFYHPRIPSANPVLITFHCGYGGHRSLHVLCASKNPARVGYGRADWGSPSHGDYGCACYCIDIARIFAVYFPPNYSGVIPDRRFSPDGKIRGYFSLSKELFVAHLPTRQQAVGALEWPGHRLISTISENGDFGEVLVHAIENEAGPETYTGDSWYRRQDEKTKGGAGV